MAAYEKNKFHNISTSLSIIVVWFFRKLMMKSDLVSLKDKDMG